MPFPPAPRPSFVLASVLAAAGMVLAAAACSQITPLAAPAAPAAPVSRLGSPIILQVLHSQPPTGTASCPAGLVQVWMRPGATAMTCFRPVGTPVTINSAAVSSVSTDRPTPPSGKPAQPVTYGFTVGVPAAQVAAVTALIAQAYQSQDAVGVSVDGKLWQAAQVLQPFPGRQFQIALISRSQALQLHRLLIPVG
ncbi:MAG TPA: hypothetical protein VEV45_02910 [Streptosporangiaceae bacterium]|nr:hypothetical protein [Streptosporangiaceae bacterium]